MIMRKILNDAPMVKRGHSMAEIDFQEAHQILIASLKKMFQEQVRTKCEDCLLDFDCNSNYRKHREIVHPC